MSYRVTMQPSGHQFTVNPDETLLDGLTLSTEYVMSYPASVLVGLAALETVEIDGQLFQVRDIRAVGDGSELRAKLSRI